jgi:phage repressor protein C with HTH and peptisase S24 domain
MVASRGEKLKIAREESGLSQDQLAERAGATQSTIDRLENDRVENSRFLPKIAAVLSKPLSYFDAELAAADSPTLTTVAQPVLGERNLPVHAAAEGGGGTMVLSSDPVDYVRRPERLVNVKDGYGIIVVGESMFPAFEPGDTLLVHPHLPPEPDTDIVLYSVHDGETRATVKRLRRATPEAWLLTQWNPPKGRKKHFTLSRKEWQTCHRVVGKYSRR